MCYESLNVARWLEGLVGRDLQFCQQYRLIPFQTSPSVSVSPSPSPKSNSTSARTHRRFEVSRPHTKLWNGPTPAREIIQITKKQGTRRAHAKNRSQLNPAVETKSTNTWNKTEQKLSPKLIKKRKFYTGAITHE